MNEQSRLWIPQLTNSEKVSYRMFFVCLFVFVCHPIVEVLL